MTQYNDVDAGIHKAHRRLVLFGSDEVGLDAATLAAAGVADGNLLSAVGFENFVGQLVATTAISTTLSIRVRPRGAHVGGGLLSDDEFVVATLTTTVGTARYTFAWGLGAGVLVAPSGGTYVYSGVFQVRVHNTGAQPATSVSIETLECV